MRFRFTLVALCLAASPAFAVSPSFDCAVAKTPDTIAICKDEALAKNDRETTRLFERLKRHDRAAALRIARSFLKERGACKSDTRCIWLSQMAAFGEFRDALGEGETTRVPSTGRFYHLTRMDIEAVRRGVRNSLKDPDSARFGDFIAARDPEHPEVIIVCGMVNAKNSFGGYTGSSPFIGGLMGAGTSRAAFGIIGIRSDDIGVKATMAMCARFGLAS